VSQAYIESFEINGKDFKNAGKISVHIKNFLREIGIRPEVIYRAAICCYEAEMNIVMYANKGKIDLWIDQDKITLVADDQGTGIPDIQLALKEGYSTATEEMREMGFGAGMGLPNMRKNADEFRIQSEVGKGTRVEMKLYLN